MVLLFCGMAEPLLLALKMEFIAQADDCCTDNPPFSTFRLPSKVVKNSPMSAINFAMGLLFNLCSPYSSFKDASSGRRLTKLAVR